MIDNRTTRDALAAERDCYVDWIGALQATPGNPWRAAVGQFGAATVVCCTGCPARIINRCFGLEPSTASHLPDILAFFAEHDAPPSIDLDPFVDYTPEFFQLVSNHGLLHCGFHQILSGSPADGGATYVDVAGATIELVGPDANAAYAEIHERVFGPGMLITSLLSHPGFHCFLAKVDGQPAALGVLHVRGTVASMANGITLPEFRRRGLQLALLGRRIEAARQLGCEWIVGQATPRNTSMRNQLRAGLSLSGTKAIWGPSSKAAEQPAG